PRLRRPGKRRRCDPRGPGCAAAPRSADSRHARAVPDRALSDLRARPDGSRAPARGRLASRGSRADPRPSRRTTLPRVRLNAFLARAGIASRRGADELIKGGRVSVNGEPGQLNTVVGKHDIVEVDG